MIQFWQLTETHHMCVRVPSLVPMYITIASHTYTWVHNLCVMSFVIYFSPLFRRWMRATWKWSARFGDNKCAALWKYFAFFAIRFWCTWNERRAPVRTKIQMPRCHDKRQEIEVWVPDSGRKMRAFAWEWRRNGAFARQRYDNTSEKNILSRSNVLVPPTVSTYYLLSTHISAALCQFPLMCQASFMQMRLLITNGVCPTVENDVKPYHDWKLNAMIARAHRLTTATLHSTAIVCVYDDNDALPPHYTIRN